MVQSVFCNGGLADANGQAGTVKLVYDSYGMLLTSTDPLGNTTTNTYDANHDLTSVTDPLGHTTTYAYDGSGNRTSVMHPMTPGSVNTTSTTVYNQYGEPTQTTDELGNVTAFSYDANFWPKLASDGIGPVVSFTFNANGMQAAKAAGYDLTQTSGAATTYTYDSHGNLTSQTDALGRATQYSYDTLGRLSSTTPPAPNAPTTYVYDALGNTKTITAPLGRVTSYTYDSNSNKIGETDANGNAKSYQYDALNRLTQVTYPTNPATTTSYTYDFRNNAINTVDQAGRTTHNVYDLAGRLISTTSAYGTASATTSTSSWYADGRKATDTDARGNTTTYTYDAAGRLTGVLDAQLNTTSYGYDDAGNQISVTDAKLHRTQSLFDARRRLTKTTYDNGTTTVYAYDGTGNLTGATDQANNTVNYTYDLANQLNSVVQPASPNAQHTTSYGYDPNGNLTGITDANSHTTADGFDFLNQLVSETLPAGPPVQTRTYDAAGNLTSLTDYNGKKTIYSYDSLNRLITTTPDPSTGDATVSFTYTATGKRATMSDASGTTTYSYDNLDRLITKATPEGTLTYTYDASGNVASMTSSNANGASVAYTWDQLSRLSAVVDNRLPGGQNTTYYGYDAASNLATVTYPNAVQSTFTYDDLNRVTGLNATRSSYAYTLGLTGNRTSATESNGRTLNWSYDGIYRLTQETIGSDPHAKNGTADYGLDPVGNRLSQTVSIPGITTGSYTYDADDRLSTETYDNNGNALTSGGKTFAYDFVNRLKSMNSGAVAIVYDGDGNRVAKTVGGVTTRYLVDDLNPTGYAQVVDEVVGSAVSRTYTYGTQRISESQVIGGAWTPSFYGYDGGGTVRFLTNTSAVVTDTYDYDAWGNEINSTGSTPNVYLYRGERWDQDLGMYYLRARYFNPTSGRFLTRDSKAERTRAPAALHRYFYAAGDAVNKIDPRGQDTIEYTEAMEIRFTSHGLEHLTELGLEASQADIQAFIEADVRQFISEYQASLQTGAPFDVLFFMEQLNNVPWAYRVFIVAQGLANIGTYFPINK